MADSKTHRWQFAARFRRDAFGSRSQPAIERGREAVAEIGPKPIAGSTATRRRCAQNSTGGEALP
jgi:hypothetical protein